MNSTLLNTIFERNKIAEEIKTILSSFDANCKNLSFKKGIYLYGSPGCGKTEFIIHILKELDYDVIKYDAGDVRNKALIETITNNNISNRNVLQMMTKKVKKIAIVMDEIDGMNNGDKGGITALIKLIRQKKTNKQRLENKTMNPIICIGNYYIDKKIKELMKVCNTFELKTPTSSQISTLLHQFVPNYTDVDYKDILINYIQGDMRKLMFVYDMFSKNSDIITTTMIDTLFHRKSYNEDSKKITKSLINHPVEIGCHTQYMNETDRTIVALLWHENIVDMISNRPIQKAFPFYSKIIDNMCFADYVDRITFQHQIWQFNEMSSLIKTFYNNKIYHDEFPANKNKFHPEEVRFTKVLTKYSTEYNNFIFIYNLCQKLEMDKKDLLAIFHELRIFNTYLEEKNKMNPETIITITDLENIFENYDISKLDIRRIYRYLDKNVKKEATDDALLEDMEE